MNARASAGIQRFAVLAVSAAMAASMWFYVQRVLIPYEKADAASHLRPRGNLSDLYPRWLGARELLLHHRNPYGDDVTREIQIGYYGRALDAANASDPKDQQGFAYPVYVVFPLAPLILFPFTSAQLFFYGLLIAVTAASVALWLEILPWRLCATSIASCILLVLGCFPAVQGFKLQQFSLLVAALLALSAAFAARGRLAMSGVLLALATVKPQLAWPGCAWLLFWAVSDWRKRRRLVVAFGSAMAVLLTASELVLPGWWRTFVGAVANYHRYAEAESVLAEMLPWAHAGDIVAAASVLLCAWALWRWRRVNTAAVFGLDAALVMSLAVLIVPKSAPYNQVLLVPAVLLMARDRKLFLAGSRAVRMLFVVSVFAVAWQWMASLGLSAAAMLGAKSWALNHWKVPLLATFAVPVLVFALMLIAVTAHELPEPSEIR
ncbi:MAG TPA: glycosyltransferase family 87 protein [Candidatus Binatia bacterium]|nr:glycosyltransferase family 87 protein [Candidatus Binatia bacterium]